MRTVTYLCDGGTQEPVGQQTTRPASSRRAPSRRRRLATRAVIQTMRHVLMLCVLSGSLLLCPGTAWAFPPFDDCKSPPVPEAPDTGLAGTFDPNILMATGGNSRYSKYGYGGLQWSTYDLGCGGSAIRDPNATADTMFGNFFLAIAVDSLALYSGLHQLTAPSHAQPGPLAPIDPAPISAAATSTSTALYGALFSPWAGVALALAAMATLLAAGRADAGAVLTRGALMIVALAVSALSFGGGAQLSNALRDSVTDALDSASRAVATQLGYDPVRGPRDMIFDGLLWPAWRAGEVGTHGSDELANKLYINQAISVDEQMASRGQNTQKLLADKGEAWKQAAAGAQSSDIVAYNNIQGRGDSRTATGLLALIQVGPLCWFQILTELLQLCLLIFLTLLPVGAPLIGLVSLALPGTLEKTVKTIGAVIAGGVVASVAGLVQMALATKLVAQQGVDHHNTGASSPSWVVTLIILAVTLLLLALVRPFMSLRAILVSSASRPSRRLLSTTQRTMLAAHVLTRSHGGGRRSGDKRRDPRPNPNQPPNGGGPDRHGGGSGSSPNPGTGNGARRGNAGHNRPGATTASPGGPHDSPRGGQSSRGPTGGDGEVRTPGRVAGRGGRTGGIDPTGPPSRPARATTSSTSTRAPGRVGVASDPIRRRDSSAANAQATVADTAAVFRPRPRPYVRPTVTPEFREPRPTEPGGTISPRREPPPRPRPL